MISSWLGLHTLMLAERHVFVCLLAVLLNSGEQLCLQSDFASMYCNLSPSKYSNMSL